MEKINFKNGNGGKITMSAVMQTVSLAPRKAPPLAYRGQRC